MNCTTLLATTQSHHLPYLDVSQTQQPCFELSKDLNTIHAYGTIPDARAFLNFADGSPTLPSANMTWSLLTAHIGTEFFDTPDIPIYYSTSSIFNQLCSHSHG